MTTDMKPVETSSGVTPCARQLQVSTDDNTFAEISIELVMFYPSPLSDSPSFRK